MFRTSSFAVQATDPIDPNSPFYKAGQYAAYVFIVIFILAIIFTVYKKSSRKK
jgi:hypothetical protein